MNNMTLKTFWKQKYQPKIMAQKNPVTYTKEQLLYKKWIAPAIGNVFIKDIKQDHQVTILSLLKKHNKSERTIQYTLMVTMSILRYAYELEYIHRLPSKISLPKFNNKRDKYFTKEESNQILEHIKQNYPNIYLPTVIALLTGMRIKEICELTWDRVDIDNQKINILDSKNHTSRTIVFPKQLQTLLYTIEPKIGYIFPNKRYILQNQYTKTLVDLGLWSKEIPNRMRPCLHTLRHTYASFLVQDDIPLYVIQKALGHSSITQTERYIHCSPNHLQAILDPNLSINNIRI